jgi:cytosine/adenosine deaminase-related metal-dependent hydrolase
MRVMDLPASIEAGKVADLVVLDANPLIAIGNTARKRAVVRRGRVFEAGSLRSMLDGVKTAVGNSGVPGGR